MKMLILFAMIGVFVNFGYTEMKVSDSWNPDGSAKILWKDMSDEQKAIHYEWERENAEYILKNIGKKCSELHEVPEYTRLFTIPPKKFGPDDICFSSDSLRLVYKSLGEYDKWFVAEREYYENSQDKGDPYARVEWLEVLLGAGRYREAEFFFPFCVNSLHPMLNEADVKDRIKKGEPPPPELLGSMMSEPWEWILDIKDKPDDLMKTYKAEEKMELPMRMHRYFYSKDVTKRAAALDFYHEKEIRFMIEKARKTWKGGIKRKAEKYLEELQKSTTVQ
jgi:hypothetical protein